MAASFFEKRGIEVSESIVFVKDEKHYLTSKAIFGILKIFWALFVMVWSLSLPLRFNNFIYNAIGKSRFVFDLAYCR